VGQVLEVIADDKGIVTDMPAWCESTGHEFLGIEEKDGELERVTQEIESIDGVREAEVVSATRSM